MNDERHSDRRVAVVTGGGRGIGRGIADQLRADGHEVVILDRDGDLAAATARALGGRSVACDIADPDQVRAAFDGLERVDVLVNNAAAWRLQTMRETTREDFRVVMETNVLGTLLCIQAAAVAMARQGGGAIVNIASTSAVSNSTGIGVYATSKAAVISLTRQAAMEYARDGITVNAVAPGVVPTEGTPHYGSADDIAARMRAYPLPRPGRPADIAGAVSYFASPAARWVTGQTLFVDGGAEAGLGHFMAAATAAAGQPR